MSQPPDELLNRCIDRFWEAIPPAWNNVRAHVRAIAMQECDISVEQFHILRHIRKGARSVSELADAGRISRPAISQAVDALVQRGMVTRRQSTDDRRYVLLDLTPEGNGLLEQVFNRAREWMKEELGSLAPADLMAIMDGLNLLKGALGMPRTVSQPKEKEKNHS